MRASHPAGGGIRGIQTHQIARRSKAGANGGVPESVPEFVHDLLADGSTLETLVGRIEWREADKSTSLGNKDLVLGQVSGGSVVFAVRDSP